MKRREILTAMNHVRFFSFSHSSLHYRAISRQHGINSDTAISERGEEKTRKKFDFFNPIIIISSEHYEVVFPTDSEGTTRDFNHMYTNIMQHNNHVHLLHNILVFKTCNLLAIKIKVNS